MPPLSRKVKFSYVIVAWQYFLRQPDVSILVIYRAAALLLSIAFM